MDFFFLSVCHDSDMHDNARIKNTRFVILILQKDLKTVISQWFVIMITQKRLISETEK